MKKIFFIILILTQCTGCSNYKEVNEMGLIIAMGVDRAKDQSNEYRVTFQVINPSQLSPTGATNSIPVINYTVEAPSMIEAYREATKIIPRENSISHLSLVVIGETVARDGLNQLFDVFSRGESRTTQPVFISRGSTAEEVLGIIEPIESNPSKSVISTSENNQNLYAVARMVPIYKAISELSSEGNNLLLSGVKLNKGLKTNNQTENLQNIKPTVIEVSGLALFKKDKLVDWYEQDLARTAQFILSEVKSTSIPLTCHDDKTITFLIKRSKSHISTKVNPRPTLQVNITLASEIAETDCNLDLNKKSVLKKLENELEKEMISQVEQTIAFAQEKNSDVFGFGEKLSKYNPKYWKSNKKDWSNIFSNADIDIHVNASIVNTRLLTNSYQFK